MRVMVTRRRGRRAEHLVVQAPGGSTVGDLSEQLEPRPTRAAGRAPETPLINGMDLDRISPTADAAGGLTPWLLVATGPDAGAAAPLPPGRWLTIGRDPRCEITLDDPGLSRRHVRVRQDRTSVRVEDLGSTNGVGWEREGDSGTWRPGDRLLLGSSGIDLLTRPSVPVTLTTRQGTSELTPWPRTVRTSEPVSLARPAPPERRTVRRPSAWTWSLPLVLSVLVATVLRMPWLLLFGLLGPAMVLGHHLGDRRAAREEHREAVEQHAGRCQEVEGLAREEARRDLERRREQHPGLVGAVSALLPLPSSRLWACLGEAVEVCLGEGRLSSSVTFEGQPLVHDGAPVVLGLAEPVAVAGPAAWRDALMRSILLQALTRHPPGELSLFCPQEAVGAGWDLLAWAPHTRLVHGDGDTPHTLRWGTDLRLLDDPADAPAGTSRVVLCSPHEAVLQRPGSPDLAFRPTLLPLPRARRLTRALAPLRQRGVPTGGPGLPGGRPTTLGDLTAWPVTCQEARAGWRRPGLDVPLGRAPDGTPVVVDLAVDGPHALVAGTTGSGKSELLRSLVVGLALRCSPADLSLLLVDYKGGSSLGDCARLPHVTGLVTDLDPHLAQRVLASLQAELTRREAVLHAVGARDIRDGPDHGLARLVVVIDEFRVLAEEVPEVMDGLVRVAAVGRSLGVHVVLATQRPAGVVNADLRANVNLRIALRVRDAADSYDVLEADDAARLPEGRPGLALLRTGADPPRAVQVACVGPPRPAGPTQVEWLISHHADAWSARRDVEEAQRTTTGEPGDDGLEQLTIVLSDAAAGAGLEATTVWLPPLPERIDTTYPDLEPGTWAVADLPAQQRRQALVWTPDQHLAIVGAARTGRSTALHTLVLGAGPVWTIVLDLGRSLTSTDLSTSPGCCGWVGPDDLAHGVRVLDRLMQVVLDRQADPAADRTPVVLAIDGWDRFVDLFGEVERGRTMDVALRILREGPSVGVAGLVTGDRSLLVGKVASLLRTTWALRMNDPSDLMMTGLRASQLPREQPPGRLVHARDGVVAQIVLPPQGGMPCPAPSGEPPFRCAALPRRWAGEGWAVGGDESAPLPSPPGPVLVLGPPSSGRTSTLHALAGVHGDPVVWVNGGRPPTEEDLRGRLSDLGPESRVVVDDAHLLTGTGTEELLLDHAAAQRLELLVSCDLDTAATAFRGLVPHVARSRTAIILQPSIPGQGTVVGATLPVGDLALPGRGVLVSRGRCTRIQVVAPVSPPASP